MLRFCGEKSAQVEWSLAYPRRANISYISLQNVSNGETKSWLCKKGDLLSQVTLGPPFFDCRITLCPNSPPPKPGKFSQGDKIRACAGAVGSGKVRGHHR